MKKLTSLLLVAALLCCLAACGNPASSPASSAAPASEPAASTAQPAADGEQVTIEFYQMKDEGTEFWDDLIAEFEKQYPNIHVEHTNVPDAETVLMTRMASDQVPDVFTHYSLDPTLHSQVDAGYMMDLTSFSALDNVDETIAEMCLYQGKAWSVPLSLNMMGVYYNKEIFEKANITETPKTIEEMYEICETLKAQGIQPFIFPDKEVWTVRQFVDRGSVTMLDDPQGLFEDIAQGNATAKDSEELRKMGETIVKLRTYGQTDSLGTGQEQAIADFSNGTAAMFFSGTFAYPEISKSNPDLQVEMFPYPSMGGEDKDRIGVNVDCCFCISATTEHPEEAKLFVEFCTNQENAQKFCDFDGSPSVIKGVTFNNDVFRKMYEDYILAGKTLDIPSNSWPASFGTAYGNINQELISNGDVDAWLENLDSIIVEYYNQ